MTKRKNPEDLQKVGRKETITTEMADRILTLFKMGMKDMEVCGQLDITPSVLYRYQTNHPEFEEKKQLAKTHLVARARRELYAGLASDDLRLRVDTAKWLLERKEKKEFSTRQELTGEDGEPLAPIINILPVEVKSEVKDGDNSDSE